MESLGTMFDYSINVLHLSADNIMERFLASGLAEKFGRGDCSIVAGCSGMELSRKILCQTGWKADFPWSPTSISSPEFWAGWALAYYQWSCGQTFKELYRRGIRPQNLIAMYYPLHEADISVFCERLEALYPAVMPAAEALRRSRKESALTQAQLAKLSGVPIRLIRAYEQGAINPMKGEYQTISALEKALKMKINS